MVSDSLLSRRLQGAEVHIGLTAFHFLLAKKAEGRASKTLLWYYNALQELARFTNGHTPSPELATLGRQEVRLWLAHLMDKGISRSSINCYFRAVNSFYNWCRDEGIIEGSPLVNMRAPRPGARPVPIFTDGHIQQMLSLCPPHIAWGARDRAIIITFLATGMRRAEMAGLTLSTVDLARDVVRVWGKGDKVRAIYLSPAAQKAIMNWLRFRRPLYETDALWLSERGTPLTDMGIDIMIRKLGRRAQVRGVRCSAHTFRHTFAVNFLRAGGSVRHLQEVMGHTSMKPLEVYLRMLTAEDAFEVHRQKDPMRRFRL